MTPDSYPTTHTIAKQLLSMDEAIAILTLPMFDMPGASQACPVEVQALEVGGRKCVVFRPLRKIPPNELVLGGGKK
jgi:hypothetical protein